MPLNLVLVSCHRFKRTQVDPLCLHDILISQYALISWHEPTSRVAQDLNFGPLQPHGHSHTALCTVACSGQTHGATEAGDTVACSGQTHGATEAVT